MGSSDQAAMAAPVVTRAVTRNEVEDFLFHESELLDTWGGRVAFVFPGRAFRYGVDTGLPDADGTVRTPAENILGVCTNDRHRLGERAKRLGKKTAHAEFPHSRTRHLITNVRITQEAAAVTATCNFVVYRSKNGVNDIYPGHSIYRLVAQMEGSFKIRSKRAVLDVDTLRPQGKVSIIL